MFFKEAMNEGMSSFEVGLQRLVFCVVVYGLLVVILKRDPIADTDPEQQGLLILRGVAGAEFHYLTVLVMPKRE